jgi:hypothetical protein
VTISWLPATLDIHASRLRPEPGVNLPLYDTLDLALSTRQNVAQWGPYECQPRLYEIACEFADKLASGTVLYRAGDLLPEQPGVSNCIYAVIQAAGQNDTLGVTTLAFGDKASRLITRRLEPWLINRNQEHLWLNERLGLDAYPIDHRQIRFWGFAGRRHAARPNSERPQ